MDFERAHNRGIHELRDIVLSRGVMKNAMGSCLAQFGDTNVLCSATIEERVPFWRRADHAGWITAEYSMLPASTNVRTPRETRGQKGRTHEIQRLIGRSLRTAVNMRAMGEITITLDCDVIQADGGTRTASITGAWVALHDALERWVEAGRIPRTPLQKQVVAVSAGVVDGNILLDLDYNEDSNAEVDMNFVADNNLEFIEVQGTGERTPFSRNKLDTLLDVGTKGIQELLRIQDECVSWSS